MPWTLFFRSIFQIYRDIFFNFKIPQEIQILNLLHSAGKFEVTVLFKLHFISKIELLDYFAWARDLKGALFLVFIWLDFCLCFQRYFYNDT